MQTMFLALLFFHFIFDYPLQGDFISRAKNRLNPIPGVPWKQAMFAHGFMHGFAVWIVTGLWTLAILELFVHMIVDDLKCRNLLTFNQDQFIHIVCKAIWVYLAYTLYPEIPAESIEYIGSIV